MPNMTARDHDGLGLAVARDVHRDRRAVDETHVELGRIDAGVEVAHLDVVDLDGRIVGRLLGQRVLDTDVELRVRHEPANHIGRQPARVELDLRVEAHPLLLVDPRALGVTRPPGDAGIGDLDALVHRQHVAARKRPAACGSRLACPIACRQMRVLQ